MTDVLHELATMGWPGAIALSVFAICLTAIYLRFIS
jgi:uncharacterized membrane protein (DUF485 family)